MKENSEEVSTSPNQELSKTAPWRSPLKMSSSWMGPKTEEVKIKDREIPLLTSAKC